MRQMMTGRSRSAGGAASASVSHAGLIAAPLMSGTRAARCDAPAAHPRACLTASYSGRCSTWESGVLPSTSGWQDSCLVQARNPVPSRGLASAHAARCQAAASTCASNGKHSSAMRVSGSSMSSGPAHNRRGLGRPAPCGFAASPPHQYRSHTAAGDPSRVAAASAASASASSSESENGDVSVEFVVESSGLSVTMRKVQTLDELRQVATLRADAYYAENQSRFVGSLKKKFVEQEVESLQQRTSATSKQGKPFCECLVAVQADSSTVLGCIDMRLPAALNGAHPAGVPAEDTGGCYLLNVVVREDVRGQGLGRAIMRAAMGRAVHTWGAARLYTHVEADNEVAYNLYAGCGFTKHSADVRYEAETKLGQTVLLLADAELVRGGGGGGAAAAAVSS